MICLTCKEQFDIYNAEVDKITGQYICPNDNTILNEDDTKG